MLILQLVGDLFQMGTIVQGAESDILCMQETLAFERGIVSIRQPHPYPSKAALDSLEKDVVLLKCNALAAVSSLAGSAALDLVGTLLRGSTSFGIMQQQLVAALALTNTASVCLLGFTAGQHLLAACRQHLCQLAGEGGVLDVDIINISEQLERGNFKAVDRKRPVNLSAVKGTAAESIAVIGTSCRVPGAESLDEFWQNLVDGKDMCEKIPDRLFRVEDYQSAAYKDKNTMRASTGNFLQRPGYWDPTVFGCTAEEAEKLDPQIRVTMMVAMEALEKAGYTFTSGKLGDAACGTILGVCSDDYQQNRSYDITSNFIPALLRANIATRINRFFGWSGPAVTMDTACSGSLVAIESACSYLLQGKANMIISGGVNILTQPQIFIGLDRGFFLSPTGQCKTLDDKGDGYSRADAVSLVVLKRLSDAVHDGDKILAVINAAATNHSGESISITHPHWQTQQRLYRSSMLAAKVSNPQEVAYAELHGTGTAAGDYEEMTSVVETYARTRDAADPLVIGSAKANLGHSESCSGATSLIKTLMAMQHQTIPKHIGIRTKLNTKLPELTGIQIPLDQVDIAVRTADGQPRALTVSNFSAAAGNTSLVLRPGPRHAAPEDSGFLGGFPVMFALSGATPSSLKGNCDRLRAYLQDYPDVDVPRLCATLATSRIDQTYFISGLVTTVDDIKQVIADQTMKKTAHGASHKVAFVFSGQGSQYLGMGKELYEHSPAFRATIDGCNETCKLLGFGDFLEAIFGEVEPSPVHFQIGLVSLEVALATLIRSWGIEPCACLGHSLGEYTALHLAGVLDLHDLIKLVGSRAQLMVQHCKKGETTMLAIKCDERAARSLMMQSGSQSIEIACFNSQTDLVLAGPLREIEKVKQAADRASPKIKSMLLPVPYAFHSAAVEPLMDAFGPVAAGITYKTPKTPIGANNGQLVKSRGFFSGKYLVNHMRQPVRFDAAVKSLMDDDPLDIFLEIGPHSTSLPMLNSIFSDASLKPLLLASMRRGTSSWSRMWSLCSQIYEARISVDWSLVFSSFGIEHRPHLLSWTLPTYAFDLANFWIDYRVSSPIAG